MSKAISRRDFLKVSGAVGAAGLLAACGGSGNAGSTATSTAASSAALFFVMRTFICYHMIFNLSRSFFVFF